MTMILRAKTRLSKTKDAEGRTVDGYPKVQVFKAYGRQWAALQDVYDDLIMLQSRPEAAVIRGELTDLGAGAEYVQRRANQDPKHFREADRSWFALDVDGAEAPTELRGAQRIERARWLVRQYVPEVLRAVSVIVQWTSSEGWDASRLYARLWYMAAEPAPDRFYRDLVKGWSGTCPELDASLYNPVQLHYTAPPIVQGGADPVGDRILPIWQGSHVVDLGGHLRKWRGNQARQALTPPKLRLVSSVDEDEDLAARILDGINVNDIEYKQWLKIGMALHDKWPAEGGIGHQLWGRWTLNRAKGSKRPAMVARAWRGFKPGAGVKFASLVQIGKEHGVESKRSKRVKTAPPGDGAGVVLTGDEDNEGRPFIDLQGDLDVKTRAVLEQLSRENEAEPRTFAQSARDMFRLVEYKGQWSVDPLVRPEEVRQHCAASMRFRKQVRHRTKEGDVWDWEPCDLPMDVARNILAAPKSLPGLWRVSRSPTFDAAGRLWSESGYCPSMEVYFDLGALKVEEPATSKEALDFLLGDVLGDFPFVDESSRVHALSLMLTPLVRGMIDGPVPLYLITAPLPRTGKTKLVNVCSLGTTGEGAELCPPSRDNEEWRKQITATLRNAPTMALIDNLEPGRNTDSANLAALLTSRTWTARELGKSQNVKVPNSTIWTATGNNPALSRELSDRSVWIHLDPACADPGARNNFQIPFIERWARENQGQICGALSVLVKSWLNAPKRARWDRNLGGFESWSEVVGGILTAAELGAHLLANKAQQKRRISPTSDEWGAFCLEWFLTHGPVPQTTTDLLNLADDKQLLDTVRGPGNDRSQKTKIGIGLRGVLDRIFTVTDPGSGDEIHLRIEVGAQTSRTRQRCYKVVRV